MQRLLALLSLTLLVLLGLAACSANKPVEPAQDLPLAADRPTFLFFFTDN